ncbi:MAG: hypothetical protein MUF49_31500 [Oculatellaceae cyanobacterium Prado106]|jgi:hypothetical protein|nr:hypothetical protein [Oculatellaceae cyanobacterium Prado106]
MIKGDFYADYRFSHFSSTYQSEDIRAVGWGAIANLHFLLHEGGCQPLETQRRRATTIAGRFI